MPNDSFNVVSPREFGQLEGRVKALEESKRERDEENANWRRDMTTKIDTIMERLATGQGRTKVLDWLIGLAATSVIGALGWLLTHPEIITVHKIG